MLWKSAPQRLSNLPLVSLVLGTGLFIFHLLTDRQYGIHGDEFYFTVCGSRPGWGYVDHPPFVPMVARLATMLFGTSMFSLRFFPALALAASCVLTGWLARRLGAGKYGEFLAAICFVFAPIPIRLGTLLNIPCFEVLFWLLTAHLLVTLCRNNEPRWWLAVGLVAGIALLNKHTTLFLGTGMAVGMLLSPRRKDLLTPWPWLGGAIAFLIFLPNLLWQYHHDWATLEFVRNLNEDEMSRTSRVDFILAQFILMNVFNAVVWICGLIFFFKNKDGRVYGMLGWIFITTAVIMLVFGAKIYYLVAAYPMILAGGAVFWERKFAGSRRLYARALLPAAIVAMGIIFIPIVSAVGTLEWKERYITKVLGFAIDDPIDLTFDFHYQLGRPEQLEVFSRVYKSLDETDRKSCVILTHEYDTASNVNVMGPALGLPPAISGSNTYYFWGPQGATGDCVIALGYEEDLLRQCFRQVTVAATIPNLILQSAPDRPVFLCREPVAPLAALWPKFKHFR